MDRQNVGGSTAGNQSSGYAFGSSRSQTVYNMDGVNMTDTAANGASAMYYDLTPSKRFKSKPVLIAPIFSPAASWSI